MAFAQTLAQMICLSDVAGLLGLGWDTVKDLVKERLERDYPDLADSRGGEWDLLGFRG